MRTKKRGPALPAPVVLPEPVAQLTVNVAVWVVTFPIQSVDL